MAERRNRMTSFGYMSGNAAYDLRSNTAHEFEQDERRESERISDTQLQRAKKTRPRVVLREQQKISLVAVGGFVMAALLAVSVLASYIQLNSIYAGTVTAQKTLTQLESTYAKLAAEDEEIFDSAVLRKAAEDADLKKPDARQQVYLELAEPDNTVVYRQETESTGLDSVVQAVKSFVSGIGAYFS